MMNKKYLSVIVLSLVLAACGKEASNEDAQRLSDNVVLPKDAPKLGTAITDVVSVDAKPDKAEIAESTTETGISQILWKDLVPDGYSPEVIFEKYEEQINAIPEGSIKEKALFETIMGELNNAPTNDKWNNKRIRMPGFVSPLEEHDGMIGEFLLVPFFGSCIHVPPPPLNQTVHVKPIKGKSITVQQSYSPVWVTGTMRVQMSETELAPAGYIIEDAELEIYMKK